MTKNLPACLLVLVAACADHKQAQVIGKDWEHFTDLREREVRHSGDWGSPPSKAGYFRESTFDMDCYNRRRGSWCCGGKDEEGRCKSRCPEYRRWCDYSYFEWPVTQTKKVTGSGDAGSFATFGNELDNDHRETHRRKYTVSFRRDRKEWRYTTSSLRRYNEFVVGDLWEIKFPTFGSMEPTKRSFLEKPEQ